MDVSRHEWPSGAGDERFTLTPNGRPEAVLLSVDDLEGLELTLEILADEESVAAISESLAELEAGQARIDDEERKVRVLDVAHRRDIYRLGDRGSGHLRF